MSFSYSTSLKALLIFGVGLQLIGCAEYSDSSPLSSNGKAAPTSFSVDSEIDRGIRAKYDSLSLVMECTRDHIQIGGTCEVNDAVDNYIEYTMVRGAANGQADLEVSWAGGVRVLQGGFCENGRFTLIVPRPEDSVISDGDRASRNCSLGSVCRSTYKLNYRIYAKKKGANQFDLAGTGLSVAFPIQLVINTGSGYVCP